jgi:hypothetical protein
MKTKFIAISGKKQTGKDTSANIIIRLLSNRGVLGMKVGFADPLKDTMCNLLNIPRELCETEEGKNTITSVLWDNFPDFIRKERIGNMTLREVLQIAGTEIFRNMFDQDIWAQRPFNHNFDGYVVIPDTRCLNELKFAQKHNALIIRVERVTGLKDEHSTEQMLDHYGFDHVVINNGTFEQLELQLTSILQKEKIL